VIWNVKLERMERRTINPSETGKDGAEAAEDGEPGLEAAIGRGARDS
jgi:hypothetical protein